MKLIPSKNKTERGSWNNFNSDTLHEFATNYNVKFVDVEDEDCWENCEDTAVIQLPSQVRWDMVQAIQNLNADEFDWQYVTVDGQSVVVRLWWD